MSNDDLGTRLSGSLHDHVDRLAGEHVGLYDVQQRAGRIRRTRRIVTVVAAAAVAAVVVPTALFVSSPSGDNGPGPVASKSPSPAAPGPVDVTVPAEPPVGDQPRVEVLDGRDYQHFVRIGGVLFLGVGTKDGNRVLDIVDGPGESSVTHTGVDQVVVSPDGTTAAWTEPDGSVWTAWEGGRLELDQQAAGVTPAAVVGDGNCGSSESDSCTVYLNPAGEGTPSFVASDGRTGTVTPDAIKVNDISDSLAATQTSYHDGRACSELYDLSLGERRWETCDYALLRFSPDGRYLMATNSDADGIGLTSISVLRATTGDPVATYRVEDGFIGAQEWEDDGHLLFVRFSYGSGSWDIVRADLDGTSQRSAEPVSASEDERPYSLEGNR
ncbi:hypothetical protein [Nocardioides sp. InS609-2]|uniref:hypothetical protein n=1 Tax=Nocardioides sp. InS609-2 TaxID=2760705 RepID=UPI0020BE9138|nr:hypothetical protein [Nocardioides sp. InS609-2]